MTTAQEAIEATWLAAPQTQRLATNGIGTEATACGGHAVERVQRGVARRRAAAGHSGRPAALLSLLTSISSMRRTRFLNSMSEPKRSWVISATALFGLQPHIATL